MDKGYNISGRVLLDPYDDTGALTGFLDPINTTEFKINIPAPNEDLLVSNSQGTEGQLLDTRYIPKPPEISIKNNTHPPQLLAALFMGKVEALSAGSGTVTDEEITLIPGRWVRLAHRLIATAGFSVATAAVPATPITSTNYEVDYEHGLIKYIGSTLTEPTACLADYSYGALSGTLIKGSAVPVLKFSVLVVGVNTANLKRCELKAPELLLYSDGLDLMTGKWISGQLKGRIKVPDSGGAPFEFREF
jgi:hypothetical protein